MKFNKIMLSAFAIIGLAATCAQARQHHRHHGPHVSFGFSVGRPMFRPVYGAPCYACRPMAVVPVAYVPVYTPYVRPTFGVSFGSGPVNFGFGF